MTCKRCKKETKRVYWIGTKTVAACQECVDAAQDMIDKYWGEDSGDSK